MTITIGAARELDRITRIMPIPYLRVSAPDRVC
jgi:hypothetical protein